MSNRDYLDTDDSLWSKFWSHAMAAVCGAAFIVVFFMEPGDVDCRLDRIPSQQHIAEAGHGRK